MIGLEFDFPIQELRKRLIYEQHVFTGCSGTHVLRLLLPLSLSFTEADEFLHKLRRVLDSGQPCKISPFEGITSSLRFALPPSVDRKSVV